MPYDRDGMEAGWVPRSHIQRNEDESKLIKKIQSLEAELEKYKGFRCPDCGGDPELAEIAKRMGFRPDIAFQQVRKVEREKAELRREVADLNQALLAMARDSDWALLVSDDEEELISNLIAKVEKGE